MSDSLPLCSIVVPTHNRSAELSRCLDSLAQLDYPSDRLEVLVVDDGGSEPLEPVIGAVTGQLNIQLIQQVNKGPASARNAGAKHAEGEVLVFIDDDCRPDKHWLRLLAGSTAVCRGDMAGGRIINGEVDNPYSAASQQLVTYLYEYFNSEESELSFFTTSNLAVPAKRFHHMGGFDTTFSLPAGEDREFCDRWQSSGYSIRYVHEAVVHHHHCLNFTGFLAQHFRYGCGAFQFHLARGKRGQNRPRIEPFSFYSGIFRYPFTQEGQLRQKLACSLLMVLTQVAHSAGYFWARGRRVFGFTVP
jgi:glycosyltransferase involved in cell wall biosynthesis